MVEQSTRPARVLVGVFPDESQLRIALEGLEAMGIASDFIGAIIKDDQSLLSVKVPAGRHEEVRSLLQRFGVTTMGVGEPAELEPHYGPIPHPGIIEDHDLKLPLGREYPTTTQPPALSGERVPSRVLEPDERIRHFGELASGYSPDEVWQEANRCLLCPQPFCREGCPARNDIPGFIRALLQGDFEKGMATLRRTSSLPGVCGRVCDYARQCEGSCLLKREGGEPITVHLLERFLADWELRERPWEKREIKAPASGKKVAIIGSGPAGLQAAHDLSLLGHSVTIFEAFPEAGGMMTVGIPAYRLPREVLTGYVAYLEALGVEIKTDTRVGDQVELADLRRSYQAILIATGAHQSMKLGVPGEEAEGVLSGIEFLRAVNLNQKVELGERVAVIGGGNTAIDAARVARRLYTATDVARVARRLGAGSVILVYRRSREEMPAVWDEVRGAEKEGIEIMFLAAPTRVIAEEGRVSKLECCRMALGEPDVSGRRRPIPIEDSEFIVEVDTIIPALGQAPNLDFAKDLYLKVSDGGALAVGKAGVATSVEGIFAAGDVVTGPATVVEAMAAGKSVGQNMDRYLTG